MKQLYCPTCDHCQTVEKLFPNVQGRQTVKACVKYPDHFVYREHMVRAEEHFCSEHTGNRETLRPRTILVRGEDLIREDADVVMSSFKLPTREFELADLVFFQRSPGEPMLCMKNRFTNFAIQNQ